jgi:tetratricopeptide (TPR) repeat protein
VSNGDLDSAAIYLIDRVKVLPERVKEETKLKANLNYWLSRLFEERNEFDKAIYHLNITTNIDSINKSFTQYSLDRFQLAELLYGKSDLSEAIRVYTQCLQTCSRNGDLRLEYSSLNKQISETGNNPELRSTLNDLKFELENEDLWKDLEARFRDVQSKFYRVLLQKHPDLTKNEVRLCSFVKLQLTTKEITALTKKSIGSVNVAKHRLKKKMDIPENQTLYSYVNSELFN